MSDPPEATRSAADRRTQLRQEIEQLALGDLVAESVRLPRTGASVEIVRPPNIDALLDRAGDDPEQQLPYWAEIWPSGVALADAILAAPEIVRDRPVLELGAGLGVTAAVALLAGADLTVTDYAPEALLFCRYNALGATSTEPEPYQLNWRQPDDALFALAGEGFPVVLAADVLYESRDVAPLIDLVGRLVAPGGLLWLAEPGRPPAARFLDAARQLGWSGSSDTQPGPWPDPKDNDVVVRVHRLSRR